MEFDKELRTKPNKYTAKSSYKKKKEFIYVGGYQSFVYDVRQEWLNGEHN